MKGYFRGSFVLFTSQLVYFDFALDYNDEESELKKPAWMDALGGETTTDVLEVRLEEIQVGVLPDINYLPQSKCYVDFTQKKVPSSNFL